MMRLADILPEKSVQENVNHRLQRVLVLRNAIADSEYFCSFESNHELRKKLETSKKLRTFFETLNWIRSHYAMWQQYVKDRNYILSGLNVKDHHNKAHLMFTAWLADYCGVINLQPGAPLLSFSVSRFLTDEDNHPGDCILGSSFNRGAIDAEIARVWRRFGGPRTAGIDYAACAAQINALNNADTCQTPEVGGDTVDVATWLTCCLRVYAFPVRTRFKNSRCCLCLDMDAFACVSCVIIALTSADDSHFIEVIDSCGLSVQLEVLAKYKKYISCQPQKLDRQVHGNIAKLLTMGCVPKVVLWRIFDEKLCSFEQNVANLTDEVLFVSDNDSADDSDSSYNVSEVNERLKEITTSKRPVENSKSEDREDTHKSSIMKRADSVKRAPKRVSFEPCTSTSSPGNSKRVCRRPPPVAQESTPIGLGLKATGLGKILKNAAGGTFSDPVVENPKTPVIIPGLNSFSEPQKPSKPVTPSGDDSGLLTPSASPEDLCATKSSGFSECANTSLSEKAIEIIPTPPIPETVPTEVNDPIENVVPTRSESPELPLPSSEPSTGTETNNSALRTHRVEIPSSGMLQKVNIKASIRLPAGCTLVDFQITVQATD